MPPKGKRKALAAKNDATGDKEVKEVQKSISEKLKSKSMSGKKTSKVDPLCSVAHKTSVYKEDDEAWEVMLNQTNIQVCILNPLDSTNSEYNMSSNFRTTTINSFCFNFWLI